MTDAMERKPSIVSAKPKDEFKPDPLSALSLNGQRHNAKVRALLQTHIENAKPPCDCPLCTANPKGGESAGRVRQRHGFCSWIENILRGKIKW